jgi:hypothetical protein
MDPADSTAPDDLVEAVGTLTEAYEYAIRARGHLYSVHQLVGRADLLAGEAADQLEAAGQAELAEQVRSHLVGRNVLHGRWTFQVVEEFDATWFDPFTDTERQVRDALVGGVRHVQEARMKDDRRTDGAPGHERRP